MIQTERAQLITFSIAQDEYALDIMRVREIARSLPVRPVPEAPRGLVGVINLRKTEVIPVLDLRERFSLPRIEDRNTSRIIVCVVDNRIIGLRVDAVVDVIDIAKREISGGVSVFHGNTSGFFAGVCHHRGKLIVLLNLKRLLSSADRIAIDAVWQQSSQHEPQGDAS